MPWDPAASHDILRVTSRDAAVSHGILHGISRDVARPHGNSHAKYRGNSPWEPMRSRTHEIPWDTMGVRFGSGFSRVVLAGSRGNSQELAETLGSSWEQVGCRRVPQLPTTSWVGSREMPRYSMGSYMGSRGMSRNPMGIHAQITTGTLPGNLLRSRGIPWGSGLGSGSRGITREFAGTRGNSRELLGTRQAISRCRGSIAGSHRN